MRPSASQCRVWHSVAQRSSRSAGGCAMVSFIRVLSAGIMTESLRAADEEHGHRPGLRSSRRPRYLKIAEQLREEIRNGTHAVGRRMPTEDVLCRRFGASRFTVREALRQLEEAGLVLRRRGSGTLVRSSEAQVAYEQHI